VIVCGYVGVIVVLKCYQGAWDASKVYTHEDVATIVEYASSLGIRCVYVCTLCVSVCVNVCVCVCQCACVCMLVCVCACVCAPLTCVYYTFYHGDVCFMKEW